MIAAKGVAEAGNVAGKGLEIGGQLATQRVMGYSKTKVKQTKRGTTTTNENIGIQAWEIIFGAGFLLIGAGIYDFVEGMGTLENQFGNFLKTLNPLDSFNPLINPLNPFQGLGRV